ncbi:DNA polymerase III subunit delta [Halosquirtibacter xylanolyticus]|uniref:DNA polymerase III subunit delta n=1 Tax=Halosquirtibacter xylanolyticus TaxID=3374599 RepID=UPI0037486154|nr:DNA polymerase III subunit delta [Prolixibacteraceae bacterium]
MSFHNILKDIEQKKFSPIYFLEGEESFYIDEITNKLESTVLTEDEKAFNQTTLYGKDTDVNEIMLAAKRFPMMSEHQLIIVKEAQNIRNIEAIDSYCKNPLQSTILVINYRYKNIDKRKALAKTIKKNGVLFDAKKPYESDIPNWINSRVKSMGYTIDPKATMLIAESIGNSLAQLSNNIDKLSIGIKPGDKITLENVEKNIGISKEFNSFELQDAIGTKDVVKANLIVNHMGGNPKQYPFAANIAVLYNYFKKLLMMHYAKVKSKDELARFMGVHPFFLTGYSKAARNYNIRNVVAIIGLLREYDRLSKGGAPTNTTEGDLLKELVYKIMHI